MSAAIETSGLTCRLGRDFAIENLTLKVPAGAIYGFLGPNGAGKSTTIRALLGMLPADAGTIRLLGEPVPDRLPRVLARTGYVPERPHLHRFLTVTESIAFHRAFYPTWDHGWAEELTKTFRLPVSRKVGQLSKGELAKLIILLAVCQTPDLLMLDEPTDGLDPVIRREVLTTIVDYVARRGASVFVSSHLVHELERLCDWIGLLDGGSLVAELPIDRFKNGIKRLRVRGEARVNGPPPFTRLGQSRTVAGDDIWLVDGWQSEMTAWFAHSGVTLERVEDLDLEEGFVERLRARRKES